MAKDGKRGRNILEDLLERWIPELILFFFFCLFRAAPTAYGGSQARGLIGAVAAGLRHSHSNTGSKPCL